MNSSKTSSLRTTYMKKTILLAILLCAYTFISAQNLVTSVAEKLSYSINKATIIVDSNDEKVVTKAALFFASDMQSVTLSKPCLLYTSDAADE